MGNPHQFTNLSPHFLYVVALLCNENLEARKALFRGAVSGVWHGAHVAD
jgi:hypothetical protein